MATGAGTVEAGALTPFGTNYVRVRQEHPPRSGQFRIVRVLESKLTAGQLAAARKNGLNSSTPPVAKPSEAAPNPAQGGQQPGTNILAGGGLSNTIGGVQPLTGPQTINPSDGAYQRELGGYTAEYDRGVNAINAELATYRSLYNRGAGDIRTAYNRDQYDSNANLAARGIVRSGEYQRRGADRLMQQARQTADLERQYGTVAQGALSGRIADLDFTLAQNKEAAAQAAMQRYRNDNPASTYLWSSLGG